MQRKATYFQHTSLSIAFCVCIAAPLLSALVQPNLRFSKAEQRSLAEIPVSPTTLGALKDYPTEFTRYYSDRFGFREILTKQYFKLTRGIDSRTATGDVTFGANDWMFLGRLAPGYNKFNDPMGDAVHQNLYTETELSAFGKGIDQVNDWLQKRDIKYLYAIAPNKHTIYFDQLPSYIKKKGPVSATDQIYQYLSDHTDVETVDLRAALIRDRQPHDLYYKTDTHWNMLGANIAQYELVKKVATMFPDSVNPRKLEFNQFSMAQKKQKGDLFGLAGIVGEKELEPFPNFKEDCALSRDPPKPKFMETHTYTCDTQSLTLLVFRDSFFSALEPYIARHFKRATYVWHPMDGKLLEESVAREKPDIVIELLAERKLPYVPVISFKEDTF